MQNWSKLLKILPPYWVIIDVTAGLVLHAVWIWRGGPRLALPAFGLVTLVAGFGLMIWAWKLFHIRGTAVCPFDSSTQFVQEGPYRFTRNPMYLGMTLILLGIAFFAGTPPVFLAPLAFFLTIHFTFIPHEEKKMEETFGEEYRNYKRRVRRWLFIKR